MTTNSIAITTCKNLLNDKSFEKMQIVIKGQPINVFLLNFACSNTKIMVLVALRRSREFLKNTNDSQHKEKTLPPTVVNNT